MAKALEFSFGGQISSFAYSKLSRDDLYGYREQLPLDANGNQARLVRLLDDGKTLVGNGGLAIGSLSSSGEWLARDQLQATLENGAVATNYPSSLGTVIDLELVVTADEVLNHVVIAVYQLEPENLEKALEEELRTGAVFRFPFAYRAGVRQHIGFLLHNNVGHPFILVTQAAMPQFIGLAQIMPPLADDEDESTDEIDFGMF